jgi:hypothetical protein
VVTVCATGSIATTSAIFTSTFGWRRKSFRSEKAMWLDASCDVATW